MAADHWYSWFDPVVGGTVGAPINCDSMTDGTQSGRPPLTLSAPPGARFNPYPGPFSATMGILSSEFPAHLHIDLLSIHTKVSEFMHILCDLVYLKDYHLCVHHQMNNHQHQWLCECVPNISQGVHSCYNSKWHNKNQIECYLNNIKSELMASCLWDSEEALDLFVLITSQ